MLNMSNTPARSQSLAIVCLLLAATAVQAGDCWVPTVEGNADQRESALYRSLLAAEAAQRADAAINAIRAVRYQVHRSISVPMHARAPRSAESYIMLHKPDGWAGDCGLQPWADEVHYASLTVHFNDLRSLEGQLEAGTDIAELHPFYEPEITAYRAGFPVYENRVLVITPEGMPPFVPVTVGEYLDLWQRRLQAEQEQVRANGAELANDTEMQAYIDRLHVTDPHTAADLQASLDEAAHMAATGAVGDEWAALQRLRASLDPETRARPVYLSAVASEPYRFGYAELGSEDARKLVKVNPALWAGLHSDQDIRVVALEVHLNGGDAFADEADVYQSEAQAWLSHLDVHPYRRLLTP